MVLFVTSKYTKCTNLSWIQLYRHIPFLKAVFIYACTAFGGPQAHFGMLHNTFVLKRKDLSESELLDYIAFCSVLPGASSTQTLTLIGYRRGGTLLAFLTLLVWILPATVLMAFFSALYPIFEGQFSLPYLFKFVESMAIGFVAFAAYHMFLLLVKAYYSKLSQWFIAFFAFTTFVLYTTPWIFPLIIILGAYCSKYLSSHIKSSPANTHIAKPVTVGIIRWKRIFIFLLIFLIVGSCSELSTQNNWKYRKQFNLFESTFRFGSLVFGGGDVLMAYMYEQYVVRPQSNTIKQNGRDVLKMTHTEFLTGSGLIRAIPGPVFSISSYVGAVLMKPRQQLNAMPSYYNKTRSNNNTILYLSSSSVQGAVIATMGVFLPSFLLVLFFFPIWQYVKSNNVVLSALSGISTAMVGIMIGTSCYLFKAMLVSDWYSNHRITITIADCLMVAAVFLMLYKRVFPAPIIVGLCFVTGILFSYFL